MTSKFFSNKNSFDAIVKKDPVQDSWGPYWFLKEQSYETHCWNSDIFTSDEVERIKTIGRRIGVSRAKTHGSGEDCLDHRRSFTSWITPNDYTAWIYQKLSTVVVDNNEKFFNFDLSMIEPIQFTYYNSAEEGLYKCHTDAQFWNLPHNRKFSIVMQLSDPSEYEGGDLVLHTGYNPTVIRKEKGLIVCFPSYTLHEVTPVTKGERYSLVAWVHGPKFR
jgi:PKHD-type hydroxylase